MSGWVAESDVYGAFGRAEVADDFGSAGVEEHEAFLVVEENQARETPWRRQNRVTAPLPASTGHVATKCRILISGLNLLMT
jgi:hypothetical protein